MKTCSLLKRRRASTCLTASEKEKVVALAREGTCSFKSDILSKEPPSSNRGVTNPLQTSLLALTVSINRGLMNFQKHLDWISVTFPADKRPSDVFPLLEWGYAGEGVHGYRSKYIDAVTGAVCFADGHTQDMGTHIQLSGSVLSELRESMGATDQALMAYISSQNGRCSRVDLALNIRGGKLTPATFYRAFTAGKIKSSARKASYIKGYKSGVTGMTFYAGNRQSDRFFRAYDKNAEQKQQNPEAWLRLELELKRLWALGAQGAVKEHGVTAVVNAQFEDFLQFDNDEYKAAISGESAPIQEFGRQQNNTERWLMEQVSVSLARVSVSRTGFLAEFMARVRGEMAILEAKRNEARIDAHS